MSARVQGSWPQFRSAVEELHLDEGDASEAESADEHSNEQNSLPLYHALRLNLQRLGHSEFFAGAAESDWRVTPPIIAITERESGWAGVLAGARSRNLLQRVAVAAAAAQCEVQTLTLPACPDQIRLAASRKDALHAVAEQAGLIFQDSAPAAILSSIPCITDPAVRRSAPLPFGPEWRVERFSPSALAWKGAKAGDANTVPLGLFRFSRRHESLTFLCSSGSTFRVPAQVGKYLVLKSRRRRILRYDPPSKRLSVPAICRPPFLVERALVLCSGEPPQYEARTSMTGLLHYTDVPAQIARLTSALLRQELR
jgi:hypothetical protein